MTNQVYPAPTSCPVCSGELIVTEKSCDTCGTAIRGRFGAFASLNDDELSAAVRFVASRGSEIEPAFDAAVEKLNAPPENELPARRAAPRPDDTQKIPRVVGARMVVDKDDAAKHADTPNHAEEDMPSPREQILRRVENGDLPPDVARQLLETR